MIGAIESKWEFPRQTRTIALCLRRDISAKVLTDKLAQLRCYLASLEVVISFTFLFFVVRLYVSWLMLFHLIYSLSFVPFTLFFSSIFFSPHLILYGVMRSGFASLNELPSAYFGVRHP